MYKSAKANINIGCEVESWQKSNKTDMAIKLEPNNPVNQQHLGACT